MADLKKFNDVVIALKATTEQLQTISNNIIGAILTDPSKLPLTGGSINGNVSATKFIGTLQGNADTASKLSTSRTINGIAFDGSSNISIPVQTWDIVIDSNAKLSTWATSGTYEKVFIKSGTWTLASGGVDLTARGTKLVVGEPGSKLVFSSAANGLYYTTLPTTNDYMMQGVSVEVSQTSSTTIFVNAFSKCLNLNYCSGKSNATVTASVTGNSAGFNACKNLMNCIAEGNAIGKGGFGNGYGAYACLNVVSCQLNSNGLGPGDFGYSAKNCTGIYHCTLTGNGTGYGYGIVDSKKCLENTVLAGKTAKYQGAYADSGRAAACADTAAGGFNS